MVETDIVEQVKAKNPIELVIEEDGFPLEGRGRYRHGRKNDSLIVDVNNQAYHWNSKGEHGDVIAWKQARMSADFKTAIEELCKRAKISEPNWGREDQATRVAARAREDAFSVANSVFVRWLWADKEALAYARSRGWTDETIQKTMIGYTGAGSNRKTLTDELKGALGAAGVDPLSPASVALLGYWGDVKRWAIDYGVSVPDEWIKDGHIPGLIARDMLIYPHLRRGRVVYFSGRGVHEKQHFNLVEPLIGKRQPYFNHEWSSTESECFVVEGQADAISLGQWGIAAVALAGTYANDDLAQILKGHQALYVGLDGDAAGQTGGLKVARTLGPLSRPVFWGVLRAASGSDELGEILAPSTTEPGVEGAEIGPGTVAIKDANDLLKELIRNEADAKEQIVQVRARMTAAHTFVEMLAEEAGRVRGADREKAQKDAFGVISKMDRIDLAQYRTRLSKAMCLTQREFDHILKTLTSESEKSHADGEPVYTWGDCVDGWLIEYLYNIDTDWAQLAWRDPEGNIGNGDDVIINGRRYLPAPPNEMLHSGAVIFPSALGVHKSIRELIAYVELYLRSIYLLPSDKMFKLISYWVMLTWLYDSFETTIYLRAMGGAGSGKSELMKRIGLVCYRTMTTNGAGSDSSLFRALERYRGTVFIDEADLDQSDTESDTVKFYNLGAMRGNPILRTVEVIGPNGEKDWETVCFQTFCPKLVAMRKEFKDDAIGSRSLTLKLTAREMIELKEAKIPLTVNRAIRAQAQGLRNLLVRWRLETWQPEVEVDAEFYDLSISARLNQVAGPLLAIAMDDAQQQEDIRQTLREYYAETILSQSMTLGARIIEAMWKIMKYPDLHKQMVKMDPEGKEIIKVGNVTKIANEIMDEMNDEEEKADEDKKSPGLKPQRVGNIIRNDLMLQIAKRQNNGFWVIWNLPRMLGLSMKYGINPDDFGPKPEDEKKAVAKQDSLV